MPGETNMETGKRDVVFSCLDYPGRASLLNQMYAASPGLPLSSLK